MDGGFLSPKEALFVEIIAEGGTIRSAAADLQVSPALLCKWLADPAREALREQYTRAREAQGDDYADRVVETAIDPTLDPAEKRVRIDAFKWAAGKRKPKVYGDKVDLTHSGGDKPIKIEAIRRVIVDPRNTDSEGVHPSAEPGEV